MNIIISCLIFLIGSIENGLCMETHTEEKTNESIVTKVCHTLDPRCYSSSTKTKLLIGGATIAATTAALLAYYTTADNEQPCLHDRIAEDGSTNPDIVNSLIEQGFAYVADNLTRCNIQLIGADLIFPKGIDEIRQIASPYIQSLIDADARIIPGLSDNHRSFLINDLSKITEFRCVGTNPCAYYDWIVNGIVCIHQSLYETTCNVTYAAIREETLKGALNMWLNITRCANLEV